MLLAQDYPQQENELQRATFVRPHQVVIEHGINEGRYFIGPGMIILKDGSILMSAPWGRPPANIIDDVSGKTPLPLLYRSRDKGITWENLGRLQVNWNYSGLISDGGISFLRLNDGRIAMVMHRHVHNLMGGGLPVISFSSDEGSSWTDPIMIGKPDDDNVAHYVMNDRLIQLQSGRLVLPVARAVGRFEGDRDESLVYYSDDGGQTWQKSASVSVADGRRGMAEPAVVELKDGKILMLARSGLGTLIKSFSNDGGQTWSEPEKTELVSPLSPFTLHRLPDSRLIVFYNHAVPYQIGSAFPRNPLCYAVSRDEGQTWSPPVIIDDTGLTDGEEGRPSLQIVYPSAVFLDEGILLLYSRHITRNRFQTRPGDKPFTFTEEQRRKAGGVSCIIAYPE